MVNSEEGAAKLWTTNNKALWLLIWSELLVLPRECSRGHEWKFSGNNYGAYCHLHCAAKLDDVFPTSGDEDEDEKAPRHKWCNYEKTWRDHGDLPFYLPLSLTPSKYLRALYWFCSDAPQKHSERDWTCGQSLDEDPHDSSCFIVVGHSAAVRSGAVGWCWPCSGH